MVPRRTGGVGRRGLAGGRAEIAGLTLANPLEQLAGRRLELPWRRSTEPPFARRRPVLQWANDCLWHEPEVPACPLFRRSWTRSGHDTDVAETTFMTHSCHSVAENGRV